MYNFGVVRGQGACDFNLYKCKPRDWSQNHKN